MAQNTPIKPNDLTIQALKPGAYQNAMTITDGVGNTLNISISVTSVKVLPTLPIKPGRVEPQNVMLTNIGQVATARIYTDQNMGGIPKITRLGSVKGGTVDYAIKRGVSFTNANGMNIEEIQITMTGPSGNYSFSISGGNPDTQSVTDWGVTPPLERKGEFPFFITCGDNIGKPGLQ